MAREFNIKTPDQALEASPGMLRKFREWISKHSIHVAPGSPEAGKVKYENQGEDEFKILGIGAKGSEKLHQHLEQEGYVLSFDGTITDEYFELKNESAPLVLGDWPRIRHRVGKRQNKNTGELENVDEFVFTLKGMEVSPGNRTEYANLVFETSQYGSKEAAHEAASNAMREFVSKNFPGIDGKDLVLWNTWRKHRTSHAGAFSKNQLDGKVYGIKKDTDTQASRMVIFQEDTVISHEDRMKLIQLYEQAGQTPPKELRKTGKGSVTLKKGFTLTMPLSGVPTYAEFEVTYPVIESGDSPEMIKEKERIFSELNGNRNKLVSYLQSEGIIDPSLPITRGNLDVVLEHYNVPDVGIKKSSKKVLEKRKAK